MSKALRGVSAIVLNWNKPAMTIQCVDNLRRVDLAEQLRIIVVDNGSTEEHLDSLRSGLPHEATLIENKTNLGYAGGMNTGIRHALESQCEHLWLVNNDAFPEAGCLESLLARMRDERTLGLVVPNLKYPDGRPQCIGASIDIEAVSIRYLFAEELIGRELSLVVLTGAAPLYRTDAIREIGGFDESFFAYREDDDLCVRLYQSGKWTAAFEPMAECVHLQGHSTQDGDISSPTTLFLMARNGWLLTKKHQRWASLPRLFFRHAVAVFLNASRFDKQGLVAQRRALLAVLRDMALQRSGKPKSLSLNPLSERVIMRFGWRLSRWAWAFSNILGPRSSRRPSPHSL